MTDELPGCGNCGHDRYVHPRHGSIDGYRCALCGWVSTTDGERLATDGGLSESFEEFLDPNTDPDATCRNCGDDVPRRFLVEGLCIGCRESGEGPAASAHIGEVDRGDGLETDGGSAQELPEIDVCPDCESPQVNHRTPGHPMNNIPDDGARYHCSNCGNDCDELVSRPRKGNPGLRGLQADLDEMDPDELPKRSDAR